MTRTVPPVPVTAAPNRYGTAEDVPPNTSLLATPSLHWVFGDTSFAILSFVAATAVKVLLIPSYCSTDLKVHRHWKAVTRHLTLGEWYWDDRHVDTVHTLDYPPTFAYFEYALSRNPITQWLLQHYYLDDRCLQLLPDSDNDPSEACVTFLRSTVILSDAILWWGAWRVASVVANISSAGPPHRTTASSSHRITFLLLVCHPGLLWLDHVHFQYNGFLLGLLLLSLSLLLQPPTSSTNAHLYLFTGAMVYATLLNLKHLYLTLSVWYAAYLFRAHCYDPHQYPRMSFLRFLQLATGTLVALALPWIPLLRSSREPVQLVVHQVMQRLFPFGRGLVHDYWAANVWALYLATTKVLAVVTRGRGLVWDDNAVSPGGVALLLLVVLLLGAWQAWKAAAERSPQRLVLSLVFTALASFQTAYHVHEKAILTALLPMLLCLPLFSNDRSRPANVALRLLLWETTAWGLLGLFPLLYEPRELLLKVTTYVAYLSGLYHVCLETPDGRTVLTTGQHRWIILQICAIATVAIILEGFPIKVWGRYEFAPLAFTSVACAAALLLATIRLGCLLWSLPSKEKVT